MSAFIVSKETMDRAVDAIHMAMSRRPAFSIEGVPFSPDPNTTTELGRALYALNIDAVCQRYRLVTSESAPGPADQSDIGENYRFDFQPCSQVASYKALRCLLYQCTEGDVPGTELYRALERITYQIADSIISGLPEYERAPWD